LYRNLTGLFTIKTIYNIIGSDSYFKIFTNQNIKCPLFWHIICLHDNITLSFGKSYKYSKTYLRFKHQRWVVKRNR
jgi:hypothetical protein